MGFVIVYPVGVLAASAKVWKPDRVCRHNCKKRQNKKTPFSASEFYPEIITHTIDKRQVT